MAQLFTSETRTINAAAAHLYAILADYRNHHPHILPTQYFTQLKVLEGGRGEGTRFLATLRVMGKENDFQMRVTEPQPGRVLAETDVDTALLTTFTVLPKGEAQAEVTIATRWEGNRGVAGLVERLTVPTLLRRIYRQELRQLEEYATGLLPVALTETDNRQRAVS